MARIAQSLRSRSRAEASQSMSEAQNLQSSPQEVSKDSSKMKRGGGKVAVSCFLGIFISYFVYGLLQEKM